MSGSWIACSDRLPSESGMYPVFIKGSGEKSWRMAAWFEVSGFGNLPGWQFLTKVFCDSITHWMEWPDDPGSNVAEFAASPQADSCMKLLDNGWAIELYKNDLGSFTAVATSPKAQAMLEAAIDMDEEDYQGVDSAIERELGKDRHITDDFTPSKALQRLTEKVWFNLVV